MTALGFRSKDAAAKFAEQFVARYTIPAFGSLSKTEVDNLVFELLVASGAIDPSASTFDNSRALNISLAKVRTLTFNWQLRAGELETALNSRLFGYLQKLRFHNDGAYVAVGIGDALVREYFIALLQRHKIFPDRTFAPELVRVPLSGFISALESLADRDAQEAIRKALVGAKIVPDTSVKGVLKEVLVKAAGKIGEKAVGKIAETAADQLSDFIGGFFSGDANAVSKAASGLIAV